MIINVSYETGCYHNGRRLTLLFLGGMCESPPSRKEGGAIMMTEYITLAGFVLAIFVFGVAVGKLVDKVERFDRWKDSEEHNDTHKNNRR